jgi:hypothetical protein
MGADVARRKNVDLLALGRSEQLAQFTTCLEQAGYGDLLDRIAAEAPALAGHLRARRASAGQSQRQAA